MSSKIKELNSNIFLSEETPSNIGEHVNHLAVVRELEKMRSGEDKKIVVLVVDQGADWDFHSPVTGLFLWRFFKKEDLDALICVSYAPGDSFTWSPGHLVT